MTTSAGWYPDPSGAPGQRYFDGTNWTPSYVPLAPQRADAPAATAPRPGINWKLLIGVLGGILAIGIITSIDSEDEKATGTSPTRSTQNKRRTISV